MKIAPDRMAALIKEHQAHAVLISSMAAGTADAQPATEGEIVAAIDRENTKTIRDANAALTAELAKAKGDHATAIAAKDAEIADLKAKLEVSGKKGVEPLNDDPKSAPPAGGAIAVYNAKLAELKAAGNKTPIDTLARQFPQINQAFIAAMNAKPSKEA